MIPAGVRGRPAACTGSRMGQEGQRKQMHANMHPKELQPRCADLSGTAAQYKLNMGIIASAP